MRYNRGAIHKDITAYGRRLERDGWTPLGEDERGNFRYQLGARPGIVTLPWHGRGRWRAEADRQVAEATGQTITRRKPDRLAAVRDPGDIHAESERISAAHAVRDSDVQRRRLMAAERNFNMYRSLMSAPPGR